MPVEGCSARKSVTRCTGATKSPPPCWAAILQRRRGRFCCCQQGNQSSSFRAAALPGRADVWVQAKVIACTSSHKQCPLEVQEVQANKRSVRPVAAGVYLSMLRCSSTPARGELPRWAQSEGCTVTTRAALAHKELRRLQQQGGVAQHMQGHAAAVPAAWHMQGRFAAVPATVRQAGLPDCWLARTCHWSDMHNTCSTRL